MSSNGRKSGSHPSGGPAGPVFSLLNRILDFLIDKFRSLPWPLRAVAYFIFLGFFCATAWRLVAGEYVVHGVIWDGDDYAKACEVRISTDYFSTNSKGMYYAVLSPLQYYRFAAVGGTDLPVACKRLICEKAADGGCREPELKPVKVPFKVSLSMWDDEFSAINLDAPTVVQKTDKAPAPFSFSLVKSAYAQPLQPPRPILGDRLIVERITRGESAMKMREVEFEIEFGSKEKPLLLQGVEAGRLPLKSTVTFGESYYFEVPQNRRGTSVSIEMETPGFFSREEEFTFQMPTQYNELVKALGSKGSTLVLRLAPPSP